VSTDPNVHGNAEVVDLLNRTLDLLAGPRKNGENLAKVEEAHSFTASGIGCEAWDETAARWSITGALAKFAMAPIPWQRLPPGAPPCTGIGTMRSEIVFDDAFRHLFAAAILQAPQTVNGVNNRGFSAVRDLITMAILLAEHGASILPVLVLPENTHPSPELRKRLDEIAQTRGASSVQVPS
jgi:hypothetical protein